MLKSLVTIEAFAKSLDPDFNIVETLTPYARRWALGDLDPKRLWDHLRRGLRHLGDFTWRFPEDVNAVLRKLRQGKVQVRIHHEHLENLTKTLDQSSNRISFALIIAALLVGSSLLVPQEGKALGFISLQSLGVGGYIFAMILGIWLVISIIRSGRL
jgi:ubiquinone biosynthesis protein